MRDPETDQFLTAIRHAVAAARTGGVTIRACLFDATTAAVDQHATGWPSAEARKTAEGVCRALEPPTIAKANPEPRPKPPALARLLWTAANWLAARKEQP